MFDQLSNTPLDKESALHYIDKVYATLTRVWDNISNIVLLQTIISIVVVALSIGIVSVEEQAEISGLKFKVTLWIILGIGVLLIEFFLIAYFSQEAHAARLEKEIARLYRKLGYVDDTMYDKLTSPFNNPASYNIIVAPSLSGKIKQTPRIIRWFDGIVSATISLLLVLILPIGAQIAAGIQLAASFGKWVWIPFTIIYLMDLWLFIASFSRREFN